MFVLGHMGIGSKLVSPFTRKLPLRFVLLGAVLPDLIDKPLYYGLSWITGRQGSELGLISGTRTFGHTAIFALLVGGIAVARHSKVAAALALGVASHLVLDNLGDYFMKAPETDRMAALLWPLKEARFPTIPYQGLKDHLGSFSNTYVMLGELAGALVLSWEVWKRKRAGLIQLQIRSMLKGIKKPSLKRRARRELSDWK